MENPYQTIFSNTDEISGSLKKLKADLTQFSSKFTFFSIINSQIEKLTDMFEKYQIIYIIYSTLAAVLLLVLIKLLAFSLYLLSCCKGCCQFCKDFQDFLRKRKEEGAQQPPLDNRQEERPYPLVNYRR